MKRKNLTFCLILWVNFLMGCIAVPEKNVRIADRLWIENDYDRRLSLWPVKYRIERVLTRFGHTQILISGEENQKTVILLHAMGLNVTAWSPNVKALSEKFRVIAIDCIGDQGRSVVRRDYPENIHEYALWLKDVLDGLQIDKVNLVGNSMGGWIVHGFAIDYPERVENLVLISPAAGIPQKTKWMGILVKMITTNDEQKLKNISRKLLGNYQASVDWIDYMAKASKDPKGAVLGMPKVFTDNELSKTGGRVLLLIGDSEYIYKSVDAVVGRAKRTITNVTVDKIPEAGHLGAWDNPYFVNSRIISFIDSN